MIISVFSSVFIRVHLPERLKVFQSGYLRFAPVVVKILLVPSGGALAEVDQRAGAG
jgi:hypothetical protein